MINADESINDSFMLALREIVSFVTSFLLTYWEVITNKKESTKDIVNSTIGSRN